MARNEQLIRQHKILQILERVRYGKTLEELRDDLVDELGLMSIHTRTVRRDLEALQAAGLDVDSHDSPRGKVWKLGPRYRQTHRISASATELIALSLGRDLLFPLAGTPFWMGIESFWNKIQEELPEPVLDHYRKFRRTLRVLGVPTKNYERQHGIVKTLNRAILEHRRVDIVYHGIGNPPKSRRIEPYTIALFQSSLYIIAAACEDRDAETRVRSWKLDRFEKADITDDRFEFPDDVSIERFVGSGLGMFIGPRPQNFRIRVSPQAARWVQEDPWHPDQQIKTLKDGSVELSVQAAHELDIIPRVLQLGSEAEILAPATARDRMADIVKRLARLYS